MEFNISEIKTVDDLKKIKITQKLLFNPNGDDDNIKIMFGDTTNILNLENIKYKWAHDLFDEIFSNNWLPHKIPMGDDNINKKKLTIDENEAYDIIISFLIFLDSIQTNNLPNIAKYITAPDIVYVLARQDYDEAIHSKSYGWILSSVYNHNEAKEINYKWRKHETLKNRIMYIADIYQDFINDESIYNFLKVIVANYLLEGLYFYNGFQFFHNLNSRGLMVGTDSQIRYIQRDEIKHCEIFANIILEIKREFPEIWKLFVPTMHEMFKEAVDWEIKFSIEVIGNKILGQTETSITNYSYFLANLRLTNINEEKIFKKIPDNPYSHLEKIAGVDDESSNRSNNFEVKSINYKTITAIAGFNDI